MGWNMRTIVILGIYCQALNEEALIPLRDLLPFYEREKAHAEMIPSTTNSALTAPAPSPVAQPWEKVADRPDEGHFGTNLASNIER